MNGLLAAVVLTGASVFTGEGPLVENATIVIDGNRISAVGPDVRIPEGARVIDAKGAVVTPGLVDAVSRLGVQDVSLESSAVEGTSGPEGGPVRASLRVADTYNPASFTIPVARGGGITSAVVAPRGGVISGQSIWVDLVEEQPIRERSLALHVSVNGMGRKPGARSRAFHMLREIFGDEKFFPFLKKFSMELASKREIVTRDIQIAAESALGGVDENGNPYNVDLNWFFDQWIRGVGIPEYNLTYKTRQTEDGSWLVEGTIKQRVVIGDHRNLRVMEGKFYRGVVDITVDAKKGETYTSRLILDGEETPFKLKVTEKPLEVALNRDGEMLAHDVVVNQPWKN